MQNFIEWISSQDNITFVIAIVGCITGVCSLVLNFYKAIIEKPKLKIEVLMPNSNGFTQNQDKTYKCKTILCIHLSFSNVGTYPVSISNIFLQSLNCKIKPVSDYKHNYGIAKDNVNSKAFHFYPFCELPKFIGVGEIAQVTLLFPFADELFAAYNRGDLKRVKIAIHMPNHKLHKSVSIAEITQESIKQS